MRAVPDWFELMKTIVTLLLIFWNAMLFAAGYQIMEKSDTVTIQSGTLATEHHVLVVRILTSQGTHYAEELAVNSYIEVSGVQGSVSCRTGKPRNIEHGDVTEVPYLQSAGYITDVNTLIIQPPDLEPGCEVTLQYDRTIKSLLFLTSWVYRSSVPIQKAYLSVTYPHAMNLRYSSLDPSITVKKNENGATSTLELQTSNQPAQTIFGDSRSESDVEKSVDLLPQECVLDTWKLSTENWASVGAWYQSMSAGATDADELMSAVVGSIVQQQKDPEKIAAALYEYIQKNFFYVAMEMGIGGYKPRRAVQTFAKKHGDCKDLAFLYIALLKTAGIEAYPALIDARWHTTLNPDFPSPLQFNHCIVYIPKIRGGIWIDCTAKRMKLGQIPSVLQGRSALVPGLNQMVKLPDLNVQSNVIHMTITGKLSGTTMEMIGKIDTTGDLSEILSSDEDSISARDRNRYVRSALLEDSLPLEGFQTTAKTTDELEVHLTSDASSAGPYKLFLVNPVRYPALENLSFSPEKNQYFSLGPSRSYELMTEADLGSVRIVSPLERKQVNGKYLNYTLETKSEAGKFVYRLNVSFTNGYLDDAQMKDYQSELQQFSDDLIRVVVIAN